MSAIKDGPIVVIGSINMDLVCQTPRMPAPGETIMGYNFETIPGGKGANQAVAAAQVSANRPVYMVGRVGDDAFGKELLMALQAQGVQTDYVQQTAQTPSGCALILVDEDGGKFHCGSARG